MSLGLFLLSCAGASMPATLPGEPSAQEASPEAAALSPTPPHGATGRPSPGPAARTETVTIQITFDTYETEETVGDELSKAPGVIAIVVSQTEITVTYDPRATSRTEIVKLLRSNPEVRVLDEP